MKKLHGWFTYSSNSGRNPMVEQPQEPSTFNKAINNPEEEISLKWREAVQKEFKEMHFRGVWKKVNKEEMPVGC
jgi:hypothetical protein